MFDTRKKLEAATQLILQKKFGESTVIHFDVSLEAEKGDLTSSAALQIAKKLQKSPKEVASEIAKAIETIEGVDRVDIAGPGFVNVTLTPDALLGGLTEARKGILPRKKRKEAPVIVDYSAPNIAKPLSIHHILSTVIGQSIVNLYAYLGYETISINHIGDWGTQFGKLAVAYKRWGKKPIGEHSLDELLTLYVRFHDEVEKDPALEEEGRAAFAALEQGDKELREFWQTVVAITMRSLEKLYERLHVRFDHTHGESFYEEKMAPIVEEGKKKNAFVAGKGGGLIVEFPESSKLPPLIVLKGDGSTIYLTRDLATARYRIDTWHPQAILYVVDVAQQLYFKQLFATLQQLGWELPHLEHVIFGRMSFADRNMSTRKGNILKLEDALGEAVIRAETLISERGEKIQTDDPEALAEMMGVGSLVYGILSQNRRMDMVFDWDKMLTLEGNSAPYLQYTHARARSVLRKANVQSINPPRALHTLTEKERYLLKLLFLFEETVEEACKTHLPHKLTNYLYVLCQAFNSFYGSEEILTAVGTLRDFRLSLTSLTADILKTGAELLTLRVPERM